MQEMSESATPGPNAEESQSPQYQVILQFKDELARSLVSGPDQHLLNQFKIRGWLGDEVDASPDELIDVALDRIKSNPSDYDNFIGMLGEDTQVMFIVDQMTGVCPLSTPTAGSYLRQHREELSFLEREEKVLQGAILQAVAASGPEFDEILRQAIELLTRIQEKLKQANPQRPVNGVNFTGGRGPTKQFYSPLMHACEEGHIERVKLLLDKGANVGLIAGESKTKLNDKSKIVGSRMTAVHVACVKGRAEIVRLLISRATNDLKENVINAKTKDKWTPLMYSVKEGHTEVVKLLLEQDTVDILATNKKGQTALHVAGQHGRLECLKLLHAKLGEQMDILLKLQEADTENPYLSTDKKGYTVLHRVCKGPKGENDENISVQCLKWIFDTMSHLDKPELLNMKTGEGYSCLLLACDCNNRDLIEYLWREKGVDVNSTTQDGKTGLHIVALHDYPEIAELLMDASISITAQDNEHKRGDSEHMVGMDTALHIAVRKSSTSVAERIRSHGDLPPEALGIRNKMGLAPHEVKREDVVPLEIRRLGDAAVNRYYQLLRRGKKKRMPRCNLIALGEQRVGKTSLLCLLMGGGFVKDRDPTRGIHNEKVDVMYLSVSAQTWKEVKSEEIAKHNELHYASSVAEELMPDFAKNENDTAHPPQPDQLRRTIMDIENHLQKIERAAVSYSAEQPKPTPRPKRPAQSQIKSSETQAKAPKRQKTVVPSGDVVERENLPTEYVKPPTIENRPSASKPQPDTSLERGSERQPVSERSEPVRSRPTSRDTVRTTNVGRNTSKAIVSGAKRGSTATEPVLQYNTLDFAGQREYRAMHHCFIVRRAIYLIVFNLQILRDALKSATEKAQRALEEIFYWMNSIHAHIHKVEPEPRRRVLLVGTHCCPKQGSTEHPQPPVTDEELSEIDKKLEEVFAGTPMVNDIFRTGDSTWIAPIENSLDREEDREKSGAAGLQRAIRNAWKELPFEKEEYPTTWLRFEAYLQRKRQSGALIVKAVIIKEAAKEEFGIGEENAGDIEMALGFFHDTGTIVYPPKLPALYLKEEEKKVLDGLILLDPGWLTKMMRKVIELQPGRDPEMTNQKQIRLKRTGCAELSLLTACWSDLGDEDFHRLILMLQSFCLVYPLPKPAENEVPRAQLQQSLKEEPGQFPSSLPPLNQVYLIPSKLQQEDFDKDQLTKFFSFEFDFGGFLPVEIYHRLLCLMLKKLPHTNRKQRFSSKYFKLYGVENCNWVIQMVGSKLCVWVKHGESSCRPSFYVSLFHEQYLKKICNENGSSLQGLNYIGGPVHMCEDDDNKPEVVPCVSFPDEKEVKDTWECPECRRAFDIEKLLNPKYVKVPSDCTVGRMTTLEGTKPTRDATAVDTPQQYSTLSELNEPQQTKLPDFAEKQSFTAPSSVPSPFLSPASTTTNLSGRPMLPQLLRLKLHKEVGANYTTFGVLLLDDETGSRVTAIEKECQKHADDVTIRILQEWLEGKGLQPVIWETLVQTLRDTGLSALADKVLTTFPSL